MLAPAFATGAEVLLHSVESRPGLNALLLQLFNSPGQFPSPGLAVSDLIGDHRRCHRALHDLRPSCFESSLTLPVTLHRLT